MASIQVMLLGVVLAYWTWEWQQSPLGLSPGQQHSVVTDRPINDHGD